MKIVQLTPGTGNFHCGSCVRDLALVKALREQGHDAIILPLYLPLVTDEGPAPNQAPVLAGGITLYMMQKFPGLNIAGPLRKLLNRPSMLVRAASRAGMTSPRDLGEMTLGGLQGLDGPQGPEWAQVIDWLAQEKPDVVSISNGLLSGLAKAISQRLPGAAILVSLQGEDSFFDTLPEPWRTQAWELFRAHQRHVTRYVAVSQFYGGTMSRRLELPEGKMEVILNGLDLSAYAPAATPLQVPAIGYLARMCHGKGLSTLVEAFIALNRKSVTPRARLRIAGAKTSVDDKYIGSLKKKLDKAGLSSAVDWLPNISFEEKVRFFQTLSVFSVPATYGEAFGLYVIEALASGVPVVQPKHGGFPEILARTGGGVLCRPDDVEDLAAKLDKLLADPAQAKALGEAGRQATLSYFTATRMAGDFIALCQRVVAVSGAA